MSQAPYILGLSASHNGAACLLRGDELLVAIQEERLVRDKRRRIYGAQPSLAVRYCLETAGITAAELALVAVAVQGPSAHADNDVTLNPQLHVGATGVPVLRVSHHLAHAASAFATSGYQDAAVLVVDGMGSPAEDLDDAERAVIRRPQPNAWEALSIYHATPNGLAPVEKQVVAEGRWLQKRPDGMWRFRTLGGMFSAVSQQLFGNESEAGKVMGLAPYGTPTLPVEAFLRCDDGELTFADEVPSRFSHHRRWPDCDDEYRALAASVQRALEEALVAITQRLQGRLGCANLCYAGGVALNSVANERVIRESGFARCHVIPAAEDSGAALGAAYAGLWRLRGATSTHRQRRDSTGRSYSLAWIDAAVAATPAVQVAPIADDEALYTEAAARLASGQIAGWLSGGSELGPRALGHRSILCDPRRPEAKEILNRRVKHREAFRPFAPAVLAEHASRWFDLGEEPTSPFMLRVCPVRPEVRARVPGIVHVDGTARPQTVERDVQPRFFALLSAFHRQTDVPLVINTSFNVMGEPIVETPEDALACLLWTGLDFCVLESRLVEKSATLRSPLDLTPRLRAGGVRIEVPIVDGRLDLGRTPPSEVRLSVETPFGPTSHVVAASLLVVIEAIDGVADGWALLAKLSQKHARFDEPALLRALATLRRTAIIGFAS